MLIIYLFNTDIVILSKGKTLPPPPPPTPSPPPPPPPPPRPPPGPSPTSSGMGGGGGIYIASNVPFSTRVWDCQIKNEKIIGRNGNIEPLREFLPSSYLLQSGVVCRMSDTTPHESLPMKTTTMRQFFRIMTCEVGLWFKDFKDYYTPNPLGVLPDPRVTEIVVCNKDELGKW